MGRGWKRIALDADTAPVPYPTEPDQGTAPRPGDRPHQLLEVLGQPVSGADDGGGLCADAGVAAAGGTDGLCASAGVDFARAVAEVGSLRGGLGAPGGGSSSRLISFLEQLPSDRPQFRGPERIARRFFPEYSTYHLRSAVARARCRRNPPDSCPTAAHHRNRAPESAWQTSEATLKPRETPQTRTLSSLRE